MQNNNNNNNNNNNDRWKSVYKLTSNATYRKTMENVTNRISVQLVSNEKDYLKCTSKRSYMPHKIFDNNFLPYIKDLKFNKPRYTGMCTLELIKILKYQFHYD